MNSCITSLVLAIASPAMAFQPSNAYNRPSIALQNTLRDMASYPDGERMMSDLEAFDRNGAFSRSPQGGMGGRPEMMYGGEYGGVNPNPFARRGGNPNDRMYTQDGFDPYSAYGASFGMSQSDRRGGPGPRGMDYYGGSGMMGGGRGMMGGGGGPNGVHNDNTIEGFSYSSRVRDYGGGGPRYDPGYDFEMGGGFEGPMMGGGMEYEQQGGFSGPNGGGGYGGFDGEMDMGRMGP